MNDEPLAYAFAATQELSVVLKMIGPKLLHKTGAGAVVLNLSTNDDVLAATKIMRQSLGKFDPGPVIDTFLRARIQLSELVQDRKVALREIKTIPLLIYQTSI